MLCMSDLWLGSSQVTDLALSVCICVQDKYYGDEKAIEQEVSLWSTIFGETESGRTDDWSIEALTDGVAQLGMQLIQGMDSVADAIGTIGDLIPDLIFGDDDEEAQAELRHMASRDKQGQVVVGGSRGRGVKKRGAHNAAPAPGTAPLKSNDELDDEETDDWTKED